MLPCSSLSSLPSLCCFQDSDAPPNLRPAPSPPYLCRNSASPPRQQWAIRSPNSWLMRGARSVCSSSSCKVGGGVRRGEEGVRPHSPTRHRPADSLSLPRPYLTHVLGQGAGQVLRAPPVLLVLLQRSEQGCPSLGLRGEVGRQSQGRLGASPSLSPTVIPAPWPQAGLDSTSELLKATRGRKAGPENLQPLPLLSPRWGACY